MTLFQWFQIAQWVVMIAVGAILFSLRAGIKGGYWLHDGESLKTRFEKAGEKMSDLATFVQQLPELIRKENDRRYMSKELSDERWNEAHSRMRELEERVRKVEIEQARKA